MYNYYSKPILINCIFSRNSSYWKGGAVYNFYTDPTLTNCTFCENSTNSYGGGIYNSTGKPRLTNCIFWGNSDDGGVDESAQIHTTGVGGPVINYSCIQGWTGGLGGAGNIGADPCFGDTNNYDYHLKSRAGRWDPNSESWVQDDVNSPCIDAGDPNSDWTAELWPHGKRINMGAYGGTPEASMSLSDAGNIADLDTDGWVGYGDMMLFTDKWLYEAVLLSEDLNRDGIVNFTDFAIFADNWCWEQ
jgi:predicted outer membrane repeat protein